MLLIHSDQILDDIGEIMSRQIEWDNTNSFEKSGEKKLNNHSNYFMKGSTSSILKSNNCI